MLAAAGWLGMTIALCAPMAYAQEKNAGETPAEVAGKVERALTDEVLATRRTFDDAFANLARMLGKRKATGAKWADLRRLSGFHRDHVRWLLTVEGGYVTPRGATNTAWMTVVPDDHPDRSTMESSLKMTAQQNFYLVQIAAEPYHPTWAMLFGVHEVTHLHDRATGLEPLEPTRDEFLDAEMRAYRHELLAADLVSDGAFTQALDDLLDVWAPKDIAALDAQAIALSDSEADALSRALGDAPEHSDAEGNLRRGFYWMALLMRHSDRNDMGDAEPKRLLDRRMRGE